MKMYCDQKLRVCYNRQVSSWFSITNGVKQGGVLSPTLFCLYVDGLLSNLKRSGVGCHIGNNYVGSIGYADDLLLLTPTLNSLKTMIKICEDYATQYDIKFNGSKSQLMVFGNQTVNSDVYVFGDKVEVVDEIKYLGYYISKDCNKSMIKPVINDFNCKFNTFMAYFEDISCDVRNTLFKQYCTSLYGHLNCALYEDSVEELNIAVRKAIRRLWHLPYRTHCNLLPHIADLQPCSVILWKRFINHFLLGCNNDNKIVSQIFKFSLFGMSRLSRNYRYIIGQIKGKLSDFVNCDKVKSKIDTFWYNNCLPEDIRIAKHIKELCIDRDDLCQKVLDSSEITDIIVYLSTS